MVFIVRVLAHPEGAATARAPTPIRRRSCLLPTLPPLDHFDDIGDAELGLAAIDHRDDAVSPAVGCTRTLMPAFSFSTLAIADAVV